LEPSTVTGKLADQLDEAYRLLEREENEAKMVRVEDRIHRAKAGK